MILRKCLSIILITLLTLFQLDANENILENPKHLHGIWEGRASYMQETTRVRLLFNQGEQLKVSMTLLDIGVSGWPAINVDVTDNEIKITFPSDSGPQIMDFNRTYNKLIGTWKDAQHGNATIQLSRVIPILPDNEQRMKIKGPAGYLGTSLILPEGKGPFPAVIFLHGSGPQPRDASRFIAQEFAKKGIAGIIFDKRGVGKSQGNLHDVSFEDLTDDAVAIANYFDSRSEISNVGFWGHSQGGWLAPLAATKWKKTAFVITSASPFVSPAREAEWGFIFPLIMSRQSEKVITQVRSYVANWHEAVRTNNWQIISQLQSELVKQTWYQQSGLESLSLTPDPNFLTSYTAFMDYEPIPTLKKLKSPMLGIFALEDESIDSQESIQILEKMIKSGMNIQLKKYPRVNHSMRLNGKQGKALRFPNHPEDYVSTQIQFIKKVLIEQ